MADERTDFRPETSGTAAAPPADDLLFTETPAVWYRRAVSRFRHESGEVASWLILMAGLTAAALVAGAALTLIISELANDVVEAAEGAVSAPTGVAPEGGDPDSGPGGNGGNTEPDPGAAPLPVRTSHCSLTLNLSGDAVGLGVGVGSTVEIIMQEMPDGTTIVTIAGDTGVSTGTGTAAGAGVTINDSTVGAYAAANADVWGALGGGVQYELAPGETVVDLFAGLAVSTNPIAGPVAGGINWLFPETIPTAELPNTVFVDSQVWGAAGGTAQAGIGWVSAGANGNVEAVANQTYAVHDNGTYSATTTYSGELNSDAGVTGGIPFFAWGSANVAGQAHGSVSVQTIYDDDFNPVEMIVTTSYGYDTDAILGSDDDNPTITTQQWTLDLTDPDVAQAVNDLDGFLPDGNPIPEFPSQNPIDAFDVLADNATTSGALAQQLSTSQLDLAVEAGAIVAGVSGGINGTCTELQ